MTTKVVPSESDFAGTKGTKHTVWLLVVITMMFVTLSLDAEKYVTLIVASDMHI